jgi:hypothetical protein
MSHNGAIRTKTEHNIYNYNNCSMLHSLFQN